MSSTGPAASGHTGWAVAVLLASLVAVDVLLVDQDAWTLTVAVLAVGVLVVLTRVLGLRPADLGLERHRLGAGLRWGSATAVLILLAIGLAAVLPIFDSAFDDDRTPDTLLPVVVKVLLVIPVRTVLLEEFAFRGVIFGIAHRAHGPRFAVLVSSLAFGLWHVPPALVVIRTNEALAEFAHSPVGVGAVVLAVVVATAVGGIVFAELRRRSGSLLAPALAHWTLNAAGTLIGYLQVTA